MAVFKCKMCGGSLEIKENETIAVCEYCGTKQTLPKLDSEKKSSLLDRADHFRRSNEYDKAMSIYEQILVDEKNDAEIYWLIVLCRYGIEYVKDPSTHSRIPTVNRVQYNSILNDEDYLKALNLADSYQKDIYIEEANKINDIQKGILEISSKEEPFDVFICYKETDENGRRTEDSVIAQDIYKELTNEGYKVFFSRITLEDKIGTAYEPYIFAALNSAKVMLVIGTKPEHYNAVWVKNEWSRYIALIQKGDKKILVPCYKNMNPYDLPEEFAYLQAQDLNKLGYMQDLIRGIEKIISVVKKSQSIDSFPNNVTNFDGLVKRAYIYLEDSDFNNADKYAERILDIDPTNGEAYLIKLLVDYKLNNFNQLSSLTESFENNDNYKKIIKYGSADLVNELNKYLNNILDIKYKKIYKNLLDNYNSCKSLEDLYYIQRELNEYSSYPRVLTLLSECKNRIKQLEEENNIKKQNELKSKFNELVDRFNCSKTIDEFDNLWREFQILNCYNSEEYQNKCDEKISELKYDDFLRAYHECKKLKDYSDLYDKYSSFKNYKDANKYLEICEKKKKKKKKIALSFFAFSFIIISIFIFFNFYFFPMKNYENAISYMKSNEYDSAYELFSKTNYKDSKKYSYEILNSGIVETKNRVVAVGLNDDKQCDVSEWENIIEISSSSDYTVGLKSDGTVVAVGSNISRDGSGNDVNVEHSKCDVLDWKNIISISAGYDHTVGLKSDGTVVATGLNNKGQCNVSDWEDIVAISSEAWSTVGLKSDGTVIATGENNENKLNVSNWKDIIAISAGGFHTVGLKSDGTVVATGWNDEGQCNVSNWKDIVAIATGSRYTVGLKSDGTVVATGWDYLNPIDVSDWKDIIAISAGDYHTVGLKSDGTLVTSGWNKDGQCNVSKLKNVIAVSCGFGHTVVIEIDKKN